jgi:hypothetical protein
LRAPAVVQGGRRGRTRRRHSLHSRTGKLEEPRNSTSRPSTTRRRRRRAAPAVTRNRWPQDGGNRGRPRPAGGRRHISSTGAKLWRTRNSQGRAPGGGVDRQRRRVREPPRRAHSGAACDRPRWNWDKRWKRRAPQSGGGGISSSHQKIPWGGRNSIPRGVTAPPPRQARLHRSIEKIGAMAIMAQITD